MKNILVSGASGIVGYGILRSLRASGMRLNLIGTTIYNDSVAQGFCDLFELAPLTTDNVYVPWLLKVIEKHRIDLLIPGIEADMYKWNESKTEIEKTGAKIVMNNEDLINLCSDKWLFYQTLEKIASPYAIESALSANYTDLVNRFGLPFLLKPRKGFGSKGIVKVNTEIDFLGHSNLIGPVLMVQPIVGTDEEEFTTSAFCNGKGGFFCFMTLKRKLSKDGFTEKAEVVEPEGIQEALKILCDYFKPLGPTNFQFRLHHEKLKLLEINPRVSSATSIRSSFGYNESLMSVNYFINGTEPDQPVVRKGRAVRYTEDFIFFA
ncbi:MAG: ATP-grasp domain-containing protein [Cyclobacteriaceae bacterium]